MGAVRSFTPAGTIEADDAVIGVSIGFSFWGYSTAWVANNGCVSFHNNVVPPITTGVLFEGPWDDLGWEYCWGNPLDPSAPLPSYVDWIYGPTWFPWVTISPLSTDIPPLNAGNNALYPGHEVSYGYDTIGSKQAFLVTWKDVINYDQAWGDEAPLRNTFQVVVYDDDTWEMNYDKVEWTTPYIWSYLQIGDLDVTEIGRAHV